jgi:MarR family transcriptional regulator for hemolysin
LNDSIEPTFGFLVHDVARSLSNAFDLYLKPFDLTRSQWRALMYVSRTPGISQAELAEQLSVGRMSVTVVLDRLQDKGYLRRVADDTDRRQNRIYLTPSAEALLPTVREAGRKWLDELLVGLSDEEQQTAVNALQRIKRNAARLLAQDEIGSGGPE